MVRQEKETNIESVSKKHINESPNKEFLRTTWEEIYRNTKKTAVANKDKQATFRYFNEKTVRYGREGHLQGAFAIS